MYEKLTRFALLPLLVGLASGCRPREGTEPHDMSAAAHERAAGREEILARESTELAAEQHSGAGCMSSYDVCWTFGSSEEHEREAERHRAVAARHRAASAALRDAEARACVGIDEEDRSTSPFEHSRDIVAVETIEETTWTGASTIDPRTRVAGAEIRFRAAPGLTGEWLQRLVDCHLARNAAIGHTRASTDMPTCPLTLAGVRGVVRSSGDGFAIAVTSDDDGIAAEIARRARALAPAPQP